MIDEFELEMAVRKGAKVLDEVQPGWADMIDIDKLSMSRGSKGFDGEACVMCQMSVELAIAYDSDGDWSKTLEMVVDSVESERLSFDRRMEWAVEHGFYRYPSGPSKYEYPILDELWTDEIRSRQIS